MSEQPSKSFRIQQSLRPPEYRTPSPPTFAIEPLSPLPQPHPPTLPSFEPQTNKKRKTEHQEPPIKADDWPSESYVPTDRSQRAPPPSIPPINTSVQPQQAPNALDLFATIATSPSVRNGDFASSFREPSSATFAAQPPNTYSASSSKSRHPKRTRSELVRWKPDALIESRPATSHVPSNIWSSQLHPGPHASDELNGHGNGQRHDARTDLASYKNNVEPDNPLQAAELLLNLSRGRPHIQNAMESPTSQYQTLGGPPIGLQDINGHACHAPDGTSGLSSRKKTIAVEYGRLDASGGTSTTGLPFPLAQANSSTRSKQLQGTSASAQPAKPPEHRGWPKGKPRGPRAIQGAPKKQGRPATKKSEGSQADRPGPKFRGRRLQASKGDSKVVLASAFDLSDLRQKTRRKSFSGASSDTDIAPAAKVSRANSAPPKTDPLAIRKPTVKLKKSGLRASETCSACKLKRNSSNHYQDLWINCNGCKAWFHTTCAGFDSERRVKEVDKYYCQGCEPKFGTTTCE